MKILYMEDHPAQRDIVSYMLQLNGFEVDIAVDGESGIYKALNWQPDLILLDLRLPGLDGYATCKKLKKTKITKNIPIIFVSPWPTLWYKQKALAVGGADFFTKPIDIYQLVRVINNLVQTNETAVKH